MITATPEGVSIDVRVVPRSARSGLAGTRGNSVLVRLHAAPVEGAANAELIEVLSTALHVPKQSVTIVSGDRSRSKTVRIRGISVEAARQRLTSDNSGRARG